jgi:uncharacterized integral membrane protein
MRKILWMVLAIVLVLVGLSFAMLNPEPAELELYVGQASLPIAVWLVLALALGAIAGVCSTFGIILRQRREIRRWRKRANDAQKELSELRKLPIRDNP